MIAGIVYNDISNVSCSTFKMMGPYLPNIGLIMVGMCNVELLETIQQIAKINYPGDFVPSVQTVNSILLGHPPTCLIKPIFLYSFRKMFKDPKSFHISSNV